MAKFKCYHSLPAFLESCSWKLTYCGPFVTAKTMIDAVLELALDPEEQCEISPLLLGHRHEGPTPGLFLADQDISVGGCSTLNASQRAAVTSSLRSPLTCLWGPPGTGEKFSI